MSRLFDNVEYPTPPEPDVCEVALIGPGYGECVLVHLGDARWVIVDSFLVRGTKVPAPLQYLRDIGQCDNSIEYVIASHWDDDHIRGLRAVLEAAPNSRFATASAFAKRDFFKFAMSYSKPYTEVQTSRVDELLAVFNMGRPIEWATASKCLLAPGAINFGHGRPVSLSTLSPSNEEQTRFLAWLATQMPKPHETRRVANTASRNQLSVVIHVTIGEAVLLLGGDLEERNEPTVGWSAIVADQGRPRAQADVFKVPHHGSSDAHHDDTWKVLLKPKPISLVAPWMNGGRVRPTQTDANRISALSSEGYVTSAAPGLKMPFDRTIEKTIKEAGIIVVPTMTQLGMVRARRKVTETSTTTWQVQTFGAARDLQAYAKHPHTPP